MPEASPKQPSSLSAAMAAAHQAIEDGRFDDALRMADRAWRLSPKSTIVCQLLMALLLAEGDADRALGVFAALDQPPAIADLAAAHVDALRLAGKLLEARAALECYLGLFAVEPEGALARAASALVAEQPGWSWVGVTPDFALTGEPVDALPAVRPIEGLELGNETVIGRRIAFPPNFSLTGSVTIQSTRISGTVRLGWLPHSVPPQLFVEDKGKQRPVRLEADDAAPGTWRFALPPNLLAKLTGRQIGLSVQLPDGTRAPLPGSPISFGTAKPYRAPKSAVPNRATSAGVAVVIPVYRGAEETRACIASVLDTVPPGTPVVIVNDASPEAGITALIERLKADPRLTVIENATNLGFPGAANIGMAAQPDHDIVLLNADTLVFSGWLERLCAHAAADRTIATVTPLSNAGSIASYPGGEESACSTETARLRDAVAASANAERHVEVPTGVGFCMFVRRACLDQVGAFDEDLFGRGYGEENDLCMRAAAHGWKHVIAGDVYVLHRNGTSFGTTRNGWMARNEAVLDQRHPTYQALVETCHKTQPLAPLRRAIDTALLREDARPIALLLSLALAGGVQRHVEARMEALKRQGYRPLLLRPDAQSGAAQLTVPDSPDLQDLVYRADEAEAFGALLASLPIGHVELHHFLGLDAAFVDACLALDAPADIFLHDYSWYCPRLSLLGANGSYCGEPGAAACQSCIAQNGSELHDSLGPESLRARSAQWLGHARNVFAPSEDVARRYARMFPETRIQIAQWEEQSATPCPITDPVPNRIAILGAVGEQKGRAVLLACARHAALHNLALEFVLIGFADEEDALLATGKVFITGRYDDAELPELLRREAPAAVFLPSVTPETWSYSLSHAMATGLPILAFDIGAIAERLGRSAHPHQLLPLGSTPAQITEALVALQQQPATSDTLPPPPQTTTQPVLSHAPEGSIMRDPGTALSSTAEFLTLARGLYHFSVTPTGNSAADPTPMLPALQIVTAPGQSRNAVEYVSAPGSEHQWLRSAKDSVILKVNGDSVKVVAMSLTAPGLAPLHIDVRKLDGEHGATAFAQEAIPAPQAITPGKPPVAPADATLLRAQIVAHVEYAGDVIGMDQTWVGTPDATRAIECLTVTPMTGISPSAIEYKTLSATGAETPWTDQGRPCGSRGRATPLLGFAIRQKPDADARFSCAYSGRFASGRIVGPMSDGALCVSPLADDRLVGLWLNVVDQAAQPARIAMSIDTIRGDLRTLGNAAPSGPRFSPFRENAA